MENFAVTLAVADNDQAPSSQPVVEEFRKECPFPVCYIHEPRRGIPMARNRILAEALALKADWVAFIDDDQTASPDWLIKLIEAAKRHDADAVQPKIIDRYPEPLPFWAAVKSTASHSDNRDEVIVKNSVGTGGTLFSARLIDPDHFGLLFDERLALAGGEDSDFFWRATQLGAKVLRSNAVAVIDEVSPTRLTYRRQVLRGLAHGGQKVFRHRYKSGYISALSRYIPISLARIFRGLGQLIVSPLFIPFSVYRFKFTSLEGGRNILFGLGAIGGLLSIQYKYYKTIDGY